MYRFIKRSFQLSFFFPGDDLRRGHRRCTGPSADAASNARARRANARHANARHGNAGHGGAVRFGASYAWGVRHTKSEPNALDANFADESDDAGSAVHESHKSDKSLDPDESRKPDHVADESEQDHAEHDDQPHAEFDAARKEQ